MLRNYLVVALRQMRRRPLHAAVNILGLALGLAVCVLILRYVQHEMSFDRFHARGDRLARVVLDGRFAEGPVTITQTPIPMAPALEAQLPEVARAVRLDREAGAVTVGGEVHAATLTFAGPAFFDLFTFPLAQGDPASALARPDGLVLSADAAARFFAAGDDPVGQALTVRFDGQARTHTVTGVAAPIPSTSSLSFDLLLPLAAMGEVSHAYRAAREHGTWRTLRPETYVLRAEGVAPAALDSALARFRREVRPDELANAIRAQPLAAMHYAPNVRAFLTTPTDPRYLAILGGLAALVLAVAVINFVTLTLGRSAQRAREVGVRKAMGAGQGQLMRQFWGEALLVTALALGLGLALAWLGRPVFARLVGQPVTLSVGAAGLAGLLALGVAVALVAGSYPAAVLARLRPALVLGGTLPSLRAPRLTRALVAVQFALAVALVVGTAGMTRQMQTLRAQHLGYQTAQVVRLEVPMDAGRRALDRLQAQADATPEIEHVAGSWETLGARGDGVEFSLMPMALDGQTIEPGDRAQEDGQTMAYDLGVTPGFAEAMGLEIVEGRALPEGDAPGVLVNEAFARAVGWNEPVGHTVSILFGVTDAPVVGVVKDFHFQSLHQPVAPLVIHTRAPVVNIYARLAPGSLPASMDVLEARWKAAAPELPLVATFLDEAVEAQYRREARAASTVRWAAGCALFVAALGLFGLAALAAQQRTREVGIRKALGASARRIALTLAGDLLRPVALAFAVGAPLAYLALERWLAGFAVRATVGPGLLAAVGAATAAVALLALAAHVVRAARLDPARTLREGG